jgi:Spy/CpxP family protein refolding chaperone
VGANDAPEQGDEVMDTDNTTHPRIARPARPRIGKRWWAGLGVLVAAGALSLSAARAQTAAGDAGGGAPMGAWGPGGGEGFMAARMQNILTKVGASDSQKSQIKAIWDGLRPQLKTLHQQGFQIRQQMAQAMTAATIDPTAVEKLRQQSVQLMDKTSALFTQGMVSTAQVLTPDQRQAALAEIQSHQGQGHHRHGPPPAPPVTQ